MQCNRNTASAICCVVVVVVVIFMIILFTGMTGDDIDNANDVKGDNNDIRTTNSKEVSLLHIETLASGQRVTNWTVILGFTTILFLLQPTASTIPVISFPLLNISTNYIAAMGHEYISKF